MVVLITIVDIATHSYIEQLLMINNSTNNNS